jgi:hypothetical protein
MQAKMGNSDDADHAEEAGYCLTGQLSRNEPFFFMNYRGCHNIPT